MSVVRMKVMVIAVGVALTTLGIGASVPTCSVYAQGAGCADGCRAAYGSCYKSTANRGACEAQLQRCLQGCSPRR
jgi:hypothetical protein